MSRRRRRSSLLGPLVVAALAVSIATGHGKDVMHVAGKIFSTVLKTVSAGQLGGGGVPGGSGHTSLSGTLSCSQLEQLWESAGGSSSAAFLAAEIAKAESAGQQYAVNTNGGASTDRGYWQINSTWGSLSTYDPYGNARAAVIISKNGTNWSPWVTYNNGAQAGQC